MTEIMIEESITQIVEEKPAKGLDLILNLKEKYNSDPSISNVLIDPCEVQMDMVRRDCPFKTEGNKLCSLGVVLKEGVPFCPLSQQRMLTLRSEFGIKEPSNSQI